MHGVIPRCNDSASRVRAIERRSCGFAREESNAFRARSSTRTVVVMTNRSDVTQARLCIDANDVERVSDFWIALFDYRMREDADDTDTWRHLEPPTTALPKLTIQPVPEHKGVKNRLHLDVFVAEPEPWIARSRRARWHVALLERGSRRLVPGHRRSGRQRVLHLPRVVATRSLTSRARPVPPWPRRTRSASR